MTNYLKLSILFGILALILWSLRIYDSNMISLSYPLGCNLLQLLFLTFNTNQTDWEL